MSKPCRKVRYPSLQSALRSKRRLLKKTGRLLCGYKCSKCKAWHLGNTRGTRQANLDRLFDNLPESDRMPKS